MTPPPGVTVLTVAELNRAACEVVEGSFPNVWVSGEVSNLTRATSGHLYFTLKDAGAELKAVMSARQCVALKFDPAAGLHVLAPRQPHHLRSEGQLPTRMRRTAPARRRRARPGLAATQREVVRSWLVRSETEEAAAAFSEAGRRRHQRQPGRRSATCWKCSRGAGQRSKSWSSRCVCKATAPPRKLRMPSTC